MGIVWYELYDMDEFHGMWYSLHLCMLYRCLCLCVYFWFKRCEISLHPSITFIVIVADNG